MSFLVRRNIERVAFVLIAALTVSVMCVSFYFERQVTKQKNLYYQLLLLRTAVPLYKAIEHQNPPSLEALLVETYGFPGDDGEKRHYLEYTPFHSMGRCIDPFGEPYTYNPTTGWVGSNAKGYKYW